MRVAAVDIGTNTVRLLLGDAVLGEAGPRLDAVGRFEVITKLGEGLDATGRLADAPMGRALDGLASYAGLIADFGADVVGGVATAATRSAANGQEFALEVAATLGFRPKIIDGVEEARLTFLGATSRLGGDETFCVIDVGGGSTEFVVGRALPEYTMSIDIGSVRLTERIESLGLHDPGEIRSYVDALFDEVAVPMQPSSLIGSGGTFVTLGAVAGEITTASVETGDETVVAMGDLVASVDRLLAMSVPEIAGLPSVPAARAEVLRAGVVCAERAVARIGTDEVTISVSDILDGIALELATPAVG